MLDTLYQVYVIRNLHNFKTRRKRNNEENDHLLSRKKGGQKRLGFWTAPLLRLSFRFDYFQVRLRFVFGLVFYVEIHF